MTRLLVVLTALTASLVPARVDAGACAMPVIEPTPLIANDTALAKDGGVVVMVENAAKGAPASWKFFNGKELAVPKTRALGAGLVVLTPPSAGDWSLEDRAAKLKVIVKTKAAATDPKPLAAPKIKSMKRQSGSGRRGSWAVVSVEAVGAAPEGAIALVVLDAKQTVRSFARVANVAQPDQPGKNAVYPVFASGSCTVVPNGTVDSQVGEKVSLAWLDSSGRLSPSTSATVTNQPLPNQKTGPSPGGD